MPKSGTYGSVRGAAGNSRPYRDNCPQHITPRLTVAQIEEGLGAMRDQIVKLEAENAGLRARLEPEEA